MDAEVTRGMRRRYLKLLAGIAATALAPGFSPGQQKKPMRLAISSESLAGANINDARAAYLVWLHELDLQFGSGNTQVVPEVFLPTDVMIRSIRQGSLDCFGIIAQEFAKVVDLIDPDTLVIQDYMTDGVEYILLVHNDSPYRKLADMRDARVATHRHRDMVLLPDWLGTLLAENNLPQAEHFFSKLMPRDSLSQVVLPVFFRSVDGALVARRQWGTAVELNPQLGRSLRILAISPKVIPIVFCFSRNTDSMQRYKLIDSIRLIASVPAGQQIVALYQSHSFIVRPLSVMKSTLDLVHQYERIVAQAAGTQKVKSPAR